jgi:hypothetical protein
LASDKGQGRMGAVTSPSACALPLATWNRWLHGSQPSSPAPPNCIGVRLGCRRSARIELPQRCQVFRLNARPRPKTRSEPTFRRNTAERVYTIEAAHNPEVAASNPGAGTAQGAGNGALSLTNRVSPENVAPVLVPALHSGGPGRGVGGVAGTSVGPFGADLVFGETVGGLGRCKAPA